MDDSQLLILARIGAARIAWHQAVLELDAAINAGIDADLPYRQIGRAAGLDHTAIVRRARRSPARTTTEE